MQEAARSDYSSPYYGGPSGNQLLPVEFGVLQLPYVTPRPDVSTSTRGPLTTTTPPSPTACRASTYRTNLNCPCKMVDQRCAPRFSVCAPTVNGEGTCLCRSGYIALNNTCVTTDFYDQNVNTTLVLLSPVIISSCFLPTNAVIGNIAQSGANGTVTYTLTLTNSLPVNVTTSYVAVESPSGNLLVVTAPPVSVVTNQTYNVTATDASGIVSNVITFLVTFNCTPPKLSFDLGNSFIIDCTRLSVGDVVVTALAVDSVSPTTFSMTLISSTSSLTNNYYSIDPNTGQIFLQNEPHGGIFAEVYGVVATNGVGQTSTPLNLTLTTSATCTP
ncbi:hypothetical protein RvY_05122 [Ramazzottius varieornatus]|uniref:Cadherin domain-containing protein n=1 Tax=Ramazzottius varieornatus TaxID=947166 RepID=A0A1D1UTY4_RAMVA|nr:hypothetical protein RvY_05122 [Ramazzottius varieornatus]